MKAYLGFLTWCLQFGVSSSIWFLGFRFLVGRLGFGVSGLVWLFGFGVSGFVFRVWGFCPGSVLRF
jgi:hypothetical protein